MRHIIIIAVEQPKEFAFKTHGECSIPQNPTDEICVHAFLYLVKFKPISLIEVCKY